ncbi:MAG: hypothetical protein MI806_25965 [Minwuiales bacterium]|nr:hypothetical protein [Minwuiales bacterium]
MVSDNPNLAIPAALTSQRRGEWIETYTGRQFWPLDPHFGDVSIIDIAHALANKCRFSGHTTRFYSVAQHSVLVSRHVPKEHALWGLLHDAAEAYLPDVASPLKNHLPGFRDFESGVGRAIAERFRLPWPMPAEVKRADKAILADERRAVMPRTHRKWDYLTERPLGIRIHPVMPQAAELAFLARFAELTEPGGV